MFRIASTVDSKVSPTFSYSHPFLSDIMIFTLRIYCYFYILCAFAISLPGLENEIEATVERIASSVSPAIPAGAEKKVPAILNPSQPIVPAPIVKEGVASSKNQNPAPHSQHAAESQQAGLVDVVLDAIKASGDHIRSHGGPSF